MLEFSSKNPFEWRVLSWREAPCFRAPSAEDAGAELERRWSDGGAAWPLPSGEGLDSPLLVDLSVCESGAVVLHPWQFYLQGTFDNVWGCFGSSHHGGWGEDGGEAVFLGSSEY